MRENQKINLEILLSAIKAKDKKAFNVLYDETISRVYNLALKITRSQDLAEEVVSDVYLQVWQQAAQFDPHRGGVMAWLMVLCRSRALDRLRKRDRVSSKAEEFIEAKHCQSIGQQDILEVLDEQSAIHQAIARLDVQQRQLLSLAYFKGYSHNELVRVTGLPLGTVKSSLRRTLSDLKTQMIARQN